MKKILFLMLLSIPFLFASCEKPVATEKVDVAFSIYDSGSMTKKDAGDTVLECIEGEASYVVTVIDGVEYTLNVLTGLDGGTSTATIKFSPGDHIVSSFVVYTADGDVLWVTPLEGSYYDNLWDLISVDLTFNVADFTKKVVPIDVLCYRDVDYEAFGFTWFQFHAYESKSVCFFGDICSKFYPDFNSAEGPYAGQVEAHDFIALFNVDIYGPGGELMNSATNVGEDINAPVCVEYLDDTEVDETYTFVISILGPTGEVFATTEGSFTDAEWSGVDSDFGGDDDIWEFVVGNCIADNTDAVVLPAYLALPSTGNITIKAVRHDNELHYEYFDVLLNSGFNNALYPPELVDGALLGGYCGDLYNNVPIEGTYDVDVYSSLGVVPPMYAGYPWNSLNWLANQEYAITEAHIEGKMLQAILWFTIHDGTPGLANKIKSSLGLTPTEVSDAQAVASIALTHSDYSPLTGEYCLVLLDPIEGSGPPVATEFVQLVLVRVDP